MSYTQDKAICHRRILDLWGAFQTIHQKYGDDVLSDEDVDLWEKITAHPAIKNALEVDKPPEGG